MTCGRTSQQNHRLGSRVLRPGATSGTESDHVSTTDSLLSRARGDLRYAATSQAQFGKLIARARTIRSSVDSAKDVIDTSKTVVRSTKAAVADVTSGIPDDSAAGSGGNSADSSKGGGGAAAGGHAKGRASGPSPTTSGAAAPAASGAHKAASGAPPRQQFRPRRAHPRQQLRPSAAQRHAARQLPCQLPCPRPDPLRGGPTRRSLKLSTAVSREAFQPKRLISRRVLPMALAPSTRRSPRAG